MSTQPDTQHNGSEHDHGDDEGHEYDHGSPEGHGHSHGLVERSIVRSREGVKAVSVSLAVARKTPAPDRLLR